MEKKIKEYAVKPEFKNAFIKIAGIAAFTIFEKGSESYNRLKELKVLDLWCDPIYEEPKFVKGKAYVFKDSLTNRELIFASKTDVKLYGCGVNILGVWIEEDEREWGADVVIREATETEIKERLSRYAIDELGLKKGVRFKSASSGREYVSSGIFGWSMELNVLIDDDAGYVFDLKAGKWAEKIEDKMETSSRDKVYEAIDSERDFQDKMTKENPDGRMRDDWDISHALHNIEKYLNKAKEEWDRESPEVNYKQTMHNLRKVAGVCVKIGEKYGMPKREN